MATEIKSQQELYDLFITELQSEAPDLTDTNEGSQIDAIGGSTSTLASEISRLILERFNKTFFNTAHGPQVTGDADDLQALAVDHFGESFARPGATKSSGVVKFERPNTTAGNVTIQAGTIVKTRPNANGEAQRFEVESTVTLTGLSVNATALALVAGSAGDVLDGEVVEIETALTDSSVTVTNEDPFSGGAEEQDDETYRETIQNKLITLAGATGAAIEAAAKTVSGIESAKAIESQIVVIEFDIATNLPKVGASYFRIPKVILYVADANGSANSTLIADVTVAIRSVKAGGVRIEVESAVAVSLNWIASITLDNSGPNYSELVNDTTRIVEAMEQYIREIPIGTGFNKAAADAAMLAVWGPSGTGDLTAFTTTTPAANVSIATYQKLIPGTVETA